MFPITDPAREGDIRMRRRRAVGLLVGIALGLAFLASGSDRAALSPARIALSIEQSRSGASSSTLSVDGDRLTVALPCASSVTVMPRADLSRRVLVSADDASGVRLAGGSMITLAGACSGASPDIHVQAPPGMPLTLALTGGTDAHVGAFTGPVTLIQHGGGDMAIDSAGGLTGEIAGSGDLAVGHLRGDLSLRMAGNGDLHVALIQASAVTVSAAGSGDIAIASGRIGHLSADMRGSGDLVVGAEVGDASVQAGDANDVSLPNVTGHLVRTDVTQAAARR